MLSQAPTVCATRSPVAPAPTACVEAAEDRASTLGGWVNETRSVMFPGESSDPLHALVNSATRCSPPRAADTDGAMIDGLAPVARADVAAIGFVGSTPENARMIAFATAARFALNVYVPGSDPVAIRT